MSDPYSIASGVVGIISLGLEIVKGLYEYCSSLKDQNSDITRIRDNLLRLHDLLDNLRRQLDSRRFHSDDINILACIEGRILQCQKCIVDLKEVADKFYDSRSSGFRAALKARVRRATYPFQQSTLQKLEGNVDSIFQQVFFSLQLLQSEDTSSIRNHVEDTRDLLKLHRANNVAQEIIKWLNAPDVTTDFNVAHEKSQPGRALGSSMARSSMLGSSKRTRFCGSTASLAVANRYCAPQSSNTFSSTRILAMILVRPSSSSLSTTLGNKMPPLFCVL
ncbi:hypothetical protein K456DRAFT_1759579 [Colletotrichum gloeosporioides 23]|nr:hypothetical protein K456DRAFT_1759579 [Colletotrichum gloeosporioides 23]